MNIRYLESFSIFSETMDGQILFFFFFLTKVINTPENVLM